MGALPSYLASFDPTDPRYGRYKAPPTADPAAAPPDPLRGLLPESYADQLTGGLKPLDPQQAAANLQAQQEALQPSSITHEIVQRDLAPGYIKHYGPKYGGMMASGVEIAAPLALGALGGGGEGEAALEIGGTGSMAEESALAGRTAELASGGETGALRGGPTESLAPYRPIYSVPRSSIAGKGFHAIATEDPGATLGAINEQGMRAGWFARGDPEQETLNEYLDALQGNQPYALDLPKQRVLAVDPKDLPPDINPPDPGADFPAETDRDIVPRWSPSITRESPYLGRREFGNLPPETGEVVPQSKITEVVGPDPNNPDNVLVRDVRGPQTTPLEAGETPQQVMAPAIGGTGSMAPSGPTGALEAGAGDTEALRRASIWSQGSKLRAEEGYPDTASAPITHTLRRETRTLPETAAAHPPRYHGTGMWIQTVGDPKEMSSPGNLYGPGFYTTDNYSIAQGYARGGPRTGEPQYRDRAIYRVYETRPLKFIHVDDPIPVGVKMRLMADEQRGALWFKRFHGKPSDLMIKRYGSNIPYDVMQPKYTKVGQVLHDVAPQSTKEFIRAMQEEGYSGVEHTGGMRTGNDPHHVKIYWDPEHDLTYREVRHISTPQHAAAYPSGDVLHPPPEIEGVSEEAWKDRYSRMARRQELTDRQITDVHTLAQHAGVPFDKAVEMYKTMPRDSRMLESLGIEPYVPAGPPYGDIEGEFRRRLAAAKK